MKKFTVSFFIVLLFSGVCFGQEVEEEPALLRFDLLSAPVKFSFDGEQSYFSTPAIVGIVTDVNLFGLEISPGLYGSMELGNDKEENKLGLVFNIGLYKAFGAGLFWEYWQAGDGFLKPEKEHTGFTFSVDIKF